MARVGRRCIVGLPNFGHWQCRLQLGLLGRMPRTRRLPYDWHDTPNIHHTTLIDFHRFCTEVGLRTISTLALRTDTASPRVVRLLPNLLADYVVFLLERDPSA